MKPKLHPLSKGLEIVCDIGVDLLTKGKTYTVLEDETKERDWRIIRVVCDDGIARKVPPQYFITPDKKLFGCRACFDRGIIHGGEDRGLHIKQCDCPSLTDENIYQP